jgi:hypothetical protein
MLFCSFFYVYFCHVENAVAHATRLSKNDVVTLGSRRDAEKSENDSEWPTECAESIRGKSAFLLTQIRRGKGGEHETVHQAGSDYTMRTAYSPALSAKKNHKNPQNLREKNKYPRNLREKTIKTRVVCEEKT